MTLDKSWLIFRDHLKAGEPQGTDGGIDPDDRDLHVKV